MRILFDTRHYVIDNEVRYLSSQADVYILERKGIKNAGAIEEAHNIPVYHLGSGLERWLARLKCEITLPTFIIGYSQILSRINPNIIVAADFYRLSSLQAFAYKRRNPSVKLVLVCETKRLPTRMLSRLVMKIMLAQLKRNSKSVEKIIVFTNEAKNFLYEQTPNIPIVVSPPVVDTDTFFPHLNRIYMPNQVLRIMMNARYVDYKRHFLLLSVLNRLKNNGYRFNLTLLGRDDNGRREIEKEVNRLSLSMHTRFIPPLSREELVKLLNDHDLLILPSYNEALGMVVPEAMACGLATITSDTVGANVYVVPGSTGYVFETDNEQDLYNKLSSCFDRELISQLGQNAREKIVSKHSIRTHLYGLSNHLL